MFLRELQVINTFLKREYETALVAITDFYAEVAIELEYGGGKPPLQPFLKILRLAINKILHNEDDLSTKVLLKEHFIELRKISPDVLQNQKDKYDKLVEQGKENDFEDEAINFMHEAGVDVGKFINFQSINTNSYFY